LFYRKLWYYTGMHVLSQVTAAAAAALFASFCSSEQCKHRKHIDSSEKT
jgi:hypothetical protein